MFPVLWIEDEVGVLEEIAPVFADLQDISTKVLLFDGYRTSEYPPLDIEDIPECKNGGKVTLELAYAHVRKWFKQIQPWLVILDLQLTSVLNDDGGEKTLYLGPTPVLGANLTLLLSEEFGAQNFLWLSQHGDNVRLYAADLTTKPWLNQPVRIVRFPHTYVLSKGGFKQGIGRGLLEALTNGTIQRIRDAKALNHIRPDRITRLSELLLSVHGNVGHYVRRMREGQDAARFKEDLASFELVSSCDPPLSFSRWCRIWHPDGKSFDSVTNPSRTLKQVTQELVHLMGHCLWGMKVSELADVLSDVVPPELHGELVQTQSWLRNFNEDKVIGPVVRESLLCAVQSAVENAVVHGNGKVMFHVLKSESAMAIYLMVCNGVEEVSKAQSALIQRHKASDLRGIRYIATSIRELNRAHRAQSDASGLGAQWGFGLFINQMELPACPSFKEGSSVDDAKERMEQCCLGVSQVAVVFRIPLVSPEELASKYSIGSA